MSIVKIGLDYGSYKHLGEVLDVLPDDVSDIVNKQVRIDHKKRGTYNANRSVSLIADKLAALGVSLVMSPENVKQVAKFRADHVVNRYRCGNDHSNVCTYVEGLGVALPVCSEVEPVKARLCCADWWERTLHKKIARAREEIAREFGAVHRFASPYISADSMKRIQAKWDRSAAIMRELVAVCQETGERIEMADILEGSGSNPVNRFAELMVRIRGFEDYAKDQNHKAVFYTLTCPSKFHAFLSNGRKNPKYQDGLTVRESQGYMVQTWARCRAKLDRMGVGRYGFRVVEPHHDGTPHWHMLLFIPANHESAVTAVISDYFKRADNAELFGRLGQPLEKKHKARVDVIHIDFSKGSAVGYLIKYIAKNIGMLSGVDQEDYETGKDAAESAPKVRGWASLHGVRQFQQIGGASVTAWRELRRVREMAESCGVFGLWSAADKGDWCQFSKLLGGCEAKRKDMPILLDKSDLELNIETGEIRAKKGRYGDLVNVVVGVVAFGELVTTKFKNWVIVRAEDALENGTPWTRVNNCTV